MSDSVSISNVKIDGKTYTINDPTKASIESVTGLLNTTVENNTLLSSANSKLDELLEKIENNNGKTQGTSFYKCITSKDASSLSWSGNKMIWNENEWQETDELGENLPISGYTPEEGRIYSEDTTIDATLYPMETNDRGC